MTNDNAIAFAMAQRQISKSAQTLLGICAGLTADGQLQDAEIRFLQTWLADHPEIAGIWPGDIITSRVESILADGVITEAERANLLEVLQFVSGNEFVATGCASPIAPAAPYDDVADISFSGKSFCFTGEFYFGTRAACERVIAKVGATAAPTVTGKLDYLVVGGLCSSAWANTTYGRKIETAIERKKRYGIPAIISEEVWSACIAKVAK